MFKTITLKGGLVLEGEDLVLFEYSNPNSNAMKKAAITIDSGNLCNSVLWRCCIKEVCVDHCFTWKAVDLTSMPFQYMSM